MLILLLHIDAMHNLNHRSRQQATTVTWSVGDLERHKNKLQCLSQHSKYPEQPPQI